MIYSCLRSFAIKRWTRLILYMLVSLSLLAFVYLSDNISDKLSLFLYMLFYYYNYLFGFILIIK